VNLTENFALSCPDETDPAAIALSMQRLAEEIEAITIPQRAALDRMLHPPTAVWVWNGTPFPISTSGFVTLDFPTSACIFNNYVDRFGLKPIWADEGFTFPAPGLYHVGVHINVIETGAITANSGRTLNAKVYESSETGALTVLELTRRVPAESVAGGSFMGCDAVVEIDANYEDFHVVSWFTHENVASNMQIAAGYAWVTRIGSNDIIEVV